jgi:DNA-binding transcriptional MerR regulator
MEIKQVIHAEVPVRSGHITWTEVIELTGLHPSTLGELIDLGWISPVVTKGETFLFRPGDVYRLRKLDRIVRDFELPLVGASIIVDLLERIEYLENKVRELSRLL